MPMKNPPHPGLSVRHEMTGAWCHSSGARAWVKPQASVGYCQLPFGDFPADGDSPRQGVRRGADTWYRLQSAWELAQAKKEAHRIKVERLAPAT